MDLLSHHEINSGKSSQALIIMGVGRDLNSHKLEEIMCVVVNFQDEIAFGFNNLDRSVARINYQICRFCYL